MSCHLQLGEQGKLLVSKGPQIRSSDVSGQEKINVPAQEERANSSSLCLFVVFWPPIDWMMPTHVGEDGSSSLSLLIQMLISSRNILRDISTKNISQLFEHP